MADQLRISTTADRYFISTVPTMPEIVVTAMSGATPLPTAAGVVWTFALDYPGFINVPGSLVRNGRARQHPPIPPVTGNPARIPFAVVMGGKLTIAVQAPVGGATLTGRRDDILIGGTNPTANDLTSAVPVKLIRQMVQQESGGAQFCDGRGGLPTTAINPNWSQDNLSGVGLGQLTVPPPSPEDAWSWRTNAASLQARFNEKRHPAATFHTRVMNSTRFKDEAAALAAWRAAEGQPPLPAKMPALTDDQQDDEGLRAYNGFGVHVADQYLVPFIHEFEPVLTTLTSATRKDAQNRPLVSPRVPAINAGGIGSWSQISGAERVARSGGHRPGDPDYVAHVRARPG